MPTTPLSPDVQTVLASLHLHEPGAANRTQAIERAAQVLPHLAALSREQLYETIVRPVLNELGAQRLRAGAAAGTPMRLVAAGGHPAPAPVATTAARPRLDVSGYPGANGFLRLMNYVRATSKGSELTHEQAHELASALAASHEVLA